MQWGSSLPEYDLLVGASTIWPYASMPAKGSTFDAFATTVLWSAMAESVVCRANVGIGAISDLDVKRFIESLLAAA